MEQQTKKQHQSVAYQKGKRARKAGKSENSCPYNGETLRAEWFAGYQFAPMPNAA